MRPWAPIPPEAFYTLKYQKRRLQRYRELVRTAQEYRFGVFDDDKMVASINLTSIEYGAFQNGRLGYSVDAEYTGKGVATEFIGHVCQFAFDRLRLHRLEANVMPRNMASQRVLQKCGFTLVGRSPGMVRINGVWEDHDMFARIADIS